MSRQQKFEQAYAEAHGMPVETFEAYRMGDTYRLPGIAKCWRFWNMALDSVVIDLSDLSNCFSPDDNGEWAMWHEDVRSLIVNAGLRVAP